MTCAVFGRKSKKLAKPIRFVSKYHTSPHRHTCLPSLKYLYEHQHSAGVTQFHGGVIMSFPKEQIINEIISAASAPNVGRAEAARLIGSSKGHLANLDSQGHGPGGRFHHGRKSLYNVRALAQWFADHIRPADGGGQ